MDKVSRTTLFARRFGHLAVPIFPLVSTITELPHTAFPRTLLAYHLLSSTELDALAVFYHQSSPKSESWTYPASIAGRWRAASSSLPYSSTPRPSYYDHFRRRQRRRKAAARLWKKIFDAPADINPSNPNQDDNNEAAALTFLNSISEQSDIHTNPTDPDPLIITEDKRRRFGRFIGLQGCESPGMTTEDLERETGEAMRLWVEQEVERRVARDKAQDEARRKGAW